MSKNHLFFECPFALACWNSLGLAHLIQRKILDLVLLFKAHFNRPFFMEIIVAMFWAIWSSQNDIIFRNLHHSVQVAKLIFKQELA